MISNLTIVLLLKDRHEFNERFLNYYLKNNHNIYLLISDGSKKKLNKEFLNKIKKNKFIKYIKFPEDKSYNIFYKKIYKTLKIIKTKYFILAANDDFLIFKTLLKCLDYLNKNGSKGYIGAGGTMLGFECWKNKKGLKQMGSFKNIYSYVKLDQKNKLKRFKSFIKSFNDLPRNCIMDRKVLMYIYKHSINLFGNNIEFKDHFTNLFNVIMGRIKIFNSPLILHETHSTSSEGNYRSKNLLSVFQNKNFLDDLSKFDQILSKKLNSKKNYIINEYHKYVLSKMLDSLALKNEPSIKQIKNIIFMKFQRKILKKNLKKNKYIDKIKLDKNTIDTINLIENYIIN